MDILKGRIARQISEQIRMLSGTTLHDGTNLEITRIDQLTSLVTVRQPGKSGSRVFQVKVSEKT